MTDKWTYYRKGDDFEDAVCFPRGCREQYLVHPKHSHSSLADRGVFLSGISHFVDPYVVQRWNPGYHVLLLTTAGTGKLEVHDTDHELTPGDLLVAPSKSKYRYQACGQWSSVWFHLANETAWATALPHDVVVVKAGYDDVVATLAKQYLLERQVHLVDSHSTQQALANLIVLFVDRELRRLPRSREHHKIHLRIERVWEQVVADPAYPWTTDRLAHQAMMSPSQFNRHVKHFYKATPIAVVLDYRMQRAREMLIFTDHTLEAIAANVGYGTAFSFSRAFKRHVGMSPSDFKKKTLTRSKRLIA